MGVALSPGGLADLSWTNEAKTMKRRMSNAAGVVGSLLVGSGSVVLVADAGVSMLAVVVTVFGTAAAVWGLMAFYLRSYLNGDALVDAELAPSRTWWWCLWRPRARRARRDQA